MGVSKDAEEANKMINSMLEILDYFKPKKWFIENPRGLLKHYPPMKVLGEPLQVWYGNYNWGFPKPTHIWSNVELWDNEKKPEMSPDLWFVRNGKRTYKAFDKGDHESLE